MKLAQLDGELLWKVDPVSFYFESDAPSLLRAQGVMFLCPKCFRANKGLAGTHRIIAWFRNRNVPESMAPKDRWSPSGTGLSDLTFVEPGPLSILLPAGCRWHGYIMNGEAVDA